MKSWSSGFFKQIINFLKAIRRILFGPYHHTFIWKGSNRIPVKYPYCDCSRYKRLSLAGLTDNINFRLLKNAGREVEIETTFRMEKGRIYDIGTDYVEIKEENGLIVTMLKENIRHIRWLDQI